MDMMFVAQIVSTIYCFRYIDMVCLEIAASAYFYCYHEAYDEVVGLRVMFLDHINNIIMTCLFNILEC